MSKTIITAREVLKYSIVDKHTAPAMVEPLIRTLEETLFRTTLGWKWYNELLEDLEDLSSYSQFNKGQVYQVGEFVEYQEEIWKCLQTTTGAELPGSSPTYWSQNPKFQTAANQTLYDNYLVYLLAWTITAKAAVFAAFRIANVGVKSDGGASLQELSAANAELISTVKALIFNMHKYLFETSGFENYAWKKKKRGPIHYQNNHGFGGFSDRDLLAGY